MSNHQAPHHGERWQSIPLAATLWRPDFFSRRKLPTMAIRPIGPGRCLLEPRLPAKCNMHGKGSDAFVQTWQLEAWHMTDWMVSVQFRGLCGKRIRQHWLKARTSFDAWYNLRRWLIWSGRRVESIGQRTNHTNLNTRPVESRGQHNP